jgi:hypothetical protein
VCECVCVCCVRFVVLSIVVLRVLCVLSR